MSYLPLNLPSRRGKFFLLTASVLLAFSGNYHSSFAAPSGIAYPNTVSSSSPVSPNIPLPTTASPNTVADVQSDVKAVTAPPSLPNVSPTASSPQTTSPIGSAPSHASVASGLSSGITIPSPPPPSAFSSDANLLAAQAEQAALQAQTDSESEARKREQEHNARSFEKAESGLLPLNPDQIRDFMKKLEQTQEASLPPSGGPPKGITRIGSISLDPGISPPQINLDVGYVSTITMVDATGQPWPILDVGIGGNFEVSPTAAGSHVVRIMPLTRFGTGDLSILLKDLPTPVIFRLSAGGPTVDLRYDARIDKFGPNAKPQILANVRPEAGDGTLAMILENAPPADAKRIKVGGLDARTKAWEIGTKVYVRTPLTLLSPAWNASMASADGTTVYEVGSAPVLLMSDNGSLLRAQILRDEDHDK